MTTRPLVPDPRPRLLEPERSTVAPSRVATEIDHWDVCPNCGAPMQVVRCKYRCTRCTYFMSCSEF